MLSNEEIKEEEQYALSDYDLKTIVNNDAKIVLYKDLKKMNYLDEMFDKLGRCILLYGVAEVNNGHWVSVMKRGNTIEFFDPYGFFPDTQNYNLMVPEETVLQQNYPYLLKLIYDGGYDLIYNNRPLQKFNDTTATCGRHSALRQLFYEIPLKEYYKVLEALQKSSKIKDLDTLITVFTEKIRSKI